MGLDLGALVAPLSDEEPSGPDLYESAERQEIESAFARGGDHEERPDAVGVDWNGTIDLILAQARQTRDLWLPAYLMRAAAQARRFDLIADGAELLAALVEERWPDVHPRLDEVGFIGRKTPCESLVRIGDFLGPLQQVPLFVHPRLGSFTGKDLLRFADEGSGAENFGMFRAMIEATPDAELHDMAARVARLGEALRRTDRVLTAHADGDTSTNFEPAYEIIGRLRQAIAQFLPGSAAGEEAGVAAEQFDGETTNSPSPAASSGEIKNRDDVVRALDRICAYYERYEPGSPVPFVLRRAKEWISLDFMAILEDIAPGSLQEAVTVLKGQQQRSSSNDGWN